MILILFSFVIFSSVIFGSVVAQFNVVIHQGESMAKAIAAHQNGFYIVFFAQLVAALFALIVLPIAYLYFFKKSIFDKIFSEHTFDWTKFWLATITIVILLPIVALVANFNVWLIELIPADTALVKWIMKSEADTKALVHILVFPSENYEYVLSTLIIAVVPAIGEELVFRGYVQNVLHQESGSKHIAIWMAAALFSFIHFQFLGFIPRMLLGALLGYMYVWSGSIFIPMLMHFFNNLFTLVLVNYLKYFAHVSDPIDVERNISWWYVMPAILLFVFLLLKINSRQTNKPI
jgi:hypothetical protein